MQLYLFQTPLLHGRIYKRLKLLALLFFLASIFSPEIKAEDSDLYSLGRIGGLVISSNNIENIQIVGVVVGLRVDNALYLESELNTSVSGGEYYSASEKGQLGISNLNLFGVYRYVFNKNFYGKIKAGISYNSLKYDISNSVDVNNDSNDFNGAIGLGLGIVFFPLTNPVMVELEFSIIDKDINMFTIGVTSPF